MTLKQMLGLESKMQMLSLRSKARPMQKCVPPASPGFTCCIVPQCSIQQPLVFYSVLQIQASPECTVIIDSKLFDKLITAASRNRSPLVFYSSLYIQSSPKYAAQVDSGLLAELFSLDFDDQGKIMHDSGSSQQILMYVLRGRDKKSQIQNYK